ncbi:MAG: hypothetical protein HKO93_05505, partial [Flavobacteriales bacterium]|nr:hypothetical protein [Flavobacteriales bacterium]
MDLLELDAESVSEMKAFYQEELAKAIRRIDHINKVLSQLGAPGVKIELRLSDDRTLKPRSKSSVPKRKYKKKRGPKSKWDKVILKTLNQAGRPLSYDELTDYLMISEAREPSKRVNTKATVQNTVFR